MFRRDWLMLVCSIALLFSLACNQEKKPETSSPTTASASAANTTTSSTTDPDAAACRLVTKAEAEEVMGEKLKDADFGPASMQGGSICRYLAPDTMSARNVTIRIESPNYNWDKVKEDKRIEGERMQPKRGHIREVQGLGKSAYFARHTLHVLTDHGILTLNVFKDPGDAAAGEEKETKAEAIEKTLAEKAVARM
jgi:hypothetical protein